MENTPNGQLIEKEPQLDPVELPDLTHTKVVDASIDGEQILKPNWNHLLDEMFRRAMGRVDGFEDLLYLFQVNLARGRKEDEGFRYLREIDISVQGQHANGACRAILTAAQALKIPLNIGILWRLKEGATYPGERRRIII